MSANSVNTRRVLNTARGEWENTTPTQPFRPWLCIDGITIEDFCVQFIYRKYIEKETACPGSPAASAPQLTGSPCTP